MFEVFFFFRKGIWPNNFERNTHISSGYVTLCYPSIHSLIPPFCSILLALFHSAETSKAIIRRGCSSSTRLVSAPLTCCICPQSNACFQLNKYLLLHVFWSLICMNWQQTLLCNLTCWCSSEAAVLQTQTTVNSSVKHITFDVPERILHVSDLLVFFFLQ